MFFASLTVWINRTCHGLVFNRRQQLLTAPMSGHPDAASWQQTQSRRPLRRAAQ
ncbi:hypothetical protein [Mycobacterium nebraskense]|uniref:hypothetical protein n=1 Tax=Mycobacterium nebraskense TaxID=244292 RepID=UPI000AB536C9|nr:hypothetical protein [Mycobacterium nebraskense]MCV7116723.1 hypothetical protein [Mycobacterium nebraskense]